MLNVKPVGKRFLVKKIEKPTTSVGGVLLIAKHTEEIHEGTIAQIGTGYNPETSPLQIGDRVLLTKWIKHEELKSGDDTYLMIDADSVIGKVKD